MNQRACEMLRTVFAAYVEGPEALGDSGSADRKPGVAPDGLRLHRGYEHRLLFRSRNTRGWRMRLLLVLVIDLSD